MTIYIYLCFRPDITIGQRFGEDSASDYNAPVAGLSAQAAGNQGAYNTGAYNTGAYNTGSYNKPQGVVISYTDTQDAQGNRRHHETHGTIGSDGKWKYDQTSYKTKTN